MKGLRPVRADDTVDVAAVGAWLAAQLPDLTGVPEISQFTGGASNLTYLLRYPHRDLVLRRPPPGPQSASAHDLAREYRFQQQLAPHYAYVPEMVALCTDHSVLGSDFYVMQRIAGRVLRGASTADFRPDEAQARTLCTRVLDLLIELHQIDVAAANLASLGRGSGFVDRQVSGWIRRFRAARTRGVPGFEPVIEWLLANQPGDVGHCVVHGDFRLDNILLDVGDPTVPRAVLDWELATIGDPLMDLGSALAYWVQADDDRLFKLIGRQPTYLPGMLRRSEVVGYYADRTGLGVDGWPFYEVFGLFRLAVIAQQIFARHRARHNHSPGLLRYSVLVRYLERRCRRVIDMA